jgi:hypothetical protein
MILRAGKNENYLDMIDNEGVVLSTSYLECEYVVSEPTGVTNLAAGPIFLEKYKSPRQNKSA